MNVIWSPSPNFGSSARGVTGRLNTAIRAEVKHRIVGSLQSAINVFADPNRQASTHFGIGTLNGHLAIVQFVDLSDMAWGNGDVRDPTWSRYRAGENPNLSTVSTEHEDGGAANGGRISEAIWQASMELSRLLRSGDLAAIRAAGIHVREPRSVAELAALPIDTGSYIDHHQLAGPNKPYCLRRWLDDPGFVEGSPSRRDRLLAYLVSGDDMSFQWAPRLATAIAGTSLHTSPTLASFNGSRLAGGPVAVLGDVDAKWVPIIVGESVLYAQKAGFVNNSGTVDPKVEQGIADAFNGTPSGDCTAQVTAARAEGVKAGTAATASKAEAQTQAWINTRPKIVA